MAATKEPKPERDRTNESLTLERTKTDDELLKRSERLEESADSVVQKARRRADDVLADARSRADERLRTSHASVAHWSTLAQERRTEDETLRRERATADEDLVGERVARRQALAALLAMERDRTDGHLGRERELSDRALASRDDFLAMASHDLRNMLGGVALSAASLVKLRCDPETQAAVVYDARRIQRYVGRMARLVSDLVDVVSIEAGRLSVSPQRHDATELVRETLEVFQPLAQATNVWIGTDVRRGSLLARYDHERILQVLANLLGNALKFTPEGGRIHILVEPSGDEVRFAVSDTGPGIPPDKLHAIFERFWQVEDASRSGLGLGLYISKCIVDAHGGKLWAESRVGEGSTFVFTLPAAEARRASNAP